MGPRYIEKTSLREVDCTRYAPIFQHPLLTRLNYVTQLSFVDTEFRGAKHSRRDHTSFVFHFADEITNHLHAKECISKEDKENIKIASAVHDIGHMPYSHASASVVEELERIAGVSIDHKTRAVDLIESDKKDRKGRTLKQCIEECGGDVKTVEDIVLKKNPLSQVISHNTLGADKTGYVLLDSNRTFYSESLPFLLDIFSHYFFDGSKLGLEDEEKVPQIRVLQTTYQDMYINVYFHPKVRFYERLFEKSIQEAVEGGIVSVKELWNLEEHDVDRMLKSNEETSKLFEKIRREEMDEKVLSLRYDTKNKKDFDRVVSLCSNPLNLSKLEKRIAEESRCDSDQITCSLTVIPNRIIPEDVFVFDWGRSVFETFPKYYESLIENANFYTRVNLFKEPELKLNKKKCEKIIIEESKKIN